MIPYQKREWRYISELVTDRKIIPSSEKEFKEYSDKTLKPKPHLPEHALHLNFVLDLRYIIISDEAERKEILSCLQKRYEPQSVAEFRTVVTSDSRRFSFLYYQSIQHRITLKAGSEISTSMANGSRLKSSITLSSRNFL